MNNLQRMMKRRSRIESVIENILNLPLVSRPWIRVKPWTRYKSRVIDICGKIYFLHLTLLVLVLQKVFLGNFFTHSSPTNLWIIKKNYKWIKPARSRVIALAFKTVNYFCSSEFRAVGVITAGSLINMNETFSSY